MPRGRTASRLALLSASRAHRHTLARLSAAWLIVLILLPFTAPFPTCEIGLAHHSSPCDVQAKDKSGAEKAVLDVLPCQTTELVVFYGSCAALSVARPEIDPPRHVVLRL